MLLRLKCKCTIFLVTGMRPQKISPAAHINPHMVLLRLLSAPVLKKSVVLANLTPVATCTLSS